MGDPIIHPNQMIEPGTTFIGGGVVAYSFRQSARGSVIDIAPPDTAPWPDAYRDRLFDGARLFAMKVKTVAGAMSDTAAEIKDGHILIQSTSCLEVVRTHLPFLYSELQYAFSSAERIKFENDKAKAPPPAAPAKPAAPAAATPAKPVEPAKADPAVKKT